MQEAQLRLVLCVCDVCLALKWAQQYPPRQYASADKDDNGPLPSNDHVYRYDRLRCVVSLYTLIQDKRKGTTMCSCGLQDLVVILLSSFVSRLDRL